MRRKLNTHWKKWVDERSFSMEWKPHVSIVGVLLGKLTILFSISHPSSMHDLLCRYPKMIEDHYDVLWASCAEVFGPTKDDVNCVVVAYRFFTIICCIDKNMMTWVNVLLHLPYCFNNATYWALYPDLTFNYVFLLLNELNVLRSWLCWLYLPKKEWRCEEFEFFSHSTPL